MFKPKILDNFKGYNKQQFTKDLLAGIIVGIVALPLAIAFGVASGVTPQQGLFTAIIAGFIISALGGSRVQIGGPTGAFIVIVYGIVQQFGINGLIIATFIAGILLIIMGLVRLGSVIKFIPHPLIVGFTTGIAVIIFSSQIKDFLGLQMGAVPADFIDKWKAFALNISTINPYSVFITIATVLITVFWGKISHKIPGPLVAIIITTAIVYFFPQHIETIGGKFGPISATFPSPVFPKLDWATIQKLIRPAFTIALLGGIESLLSAVVADGMTGGNHRSNTELIAQGIANMFSALFGGIPATGAIARTATNINNGGRTPVAGMIHAIVLFVILFFIGKWAALIPMATLAGILIVVAYNMSEYRTFITITKVWSSDTAILLTTFLLTVLVDITVAIEVGMILAAFLFMRKMTKSSNVTNLTAQLYEAPDYEDPNPISNYQIPENITVYEINGPLFFGAAYKFKDAIRVIEKKPRVLIIRMRYVPIIDATGSHILEEVEKECKSSGIKLILSEIHSEQLMEELQKTRLSFKIGKGNIVPTFKDAIIRSENIIAGR